jgi:MoaA/NifB/PqqE/SkfB family radical SAM enzyme
MSLKYLWYRAKFRLAPYLPLKGPVHLDLELAGKCQLACVMCPFGEGTFDDSKQGMMPWSMAKAALEQAREEMGALSVKLNFRGEPGLAPKLIAAVKYAKELGFVETIVNTNLTSFSKRRLKAVADAGLDLMIVSVDGATAETYESIRINGDFEKLMANLRYLNTLPNRPRIRINMTVQYKNRHEAGMMDEVLGDLCDEIRFNPIRSDNSGERKKCSQPFQRLTVMWDGQVGGCCSNWNNEAVVGKFPEQSLQEIWGGKERKDLLFSATTPGRWSPCRGCLVGDSYK